MPGIAETVAYGIEDIWHRSSIPVVGHRQIVRRIYQYHGKYRNILRSLNNNAFIDLKQEFLRYARQLFNVTAFKCSSGTDCVCDIPSKVPSLEREFLEDQRRDLKMIIGAIDVQGNIYMKRGCAG